MSRPLHFVIALGGVFAALSVTAPSTAAAVVPSVSPLAKVSSRPAAARLASYRVSYALTLVRADPGGTVVAGDGRISVEFADVCQGYTLTQRLRTRTADDGGAVVESDLTSSSFESRDGKLLQFAIRNRVNGIVVESYNGVARIPKPGGAGRAVFTQPKRTPLVLPAGTVFPTMQLRLLLQAATAGRNFVSVPVFDGPGEGGLSQTGSFIGKRQPGRNVGVPAGLKGLAWWPVRMAYFAANGHAMRPDYEVGFRLFANGVSSRLVLDFPSFSFDGRLTHFRLLPPFPCRHG